MSKEINPSSREREEEKAESEEERLDREKRILEISKDRWKALAYQMEQKRNEWRLAFILSVILLSMLGIIILLQVL